MRDHQVSLAQTLGDQNWTFLCFTEDRARKVATMLAEIGVKRGQPLTIRRTTIPAGVLWNAQPCKLYSVPKGELDDLALHRGLCKHLGYELLYLASDVFTLGIPCEADEALNRVGLFSRK
jgi:hypothetical protein